MTIPFDMILSICQYIEREPYIQSNKIYFRFTKDFLQKHPASNLKRKIHFCSSSILLELPTNINKCVKPLNFVGQKFLYHCIYLDDRVSYKFEYGYTILYNDIPIYRSVNKMTIINPIRHTIMNFECNKN